jgi:hypothetical protein
MTWRVSSRLALVASTALALAAPAAAKGPATLEICGADACRTFEADPARSDRNVELVFSALNVAFDGFEFVAAPAPAPFYTLRVSAEGLDDVEPRTYVRSEGLMSVDSRWVRLQGSLARRYLRATAGLAPAAPPVVREARVAGVTVDDPAPYGRLLDDLPRVAAAAPGQPSVEIRLTPDRVTAWADPERPLRFYADEDLLRRGFEWVRVPPEVVAAIERDAGYETDAGAIRAVPLALAAAIAATLLAAGWLLLARRRGARRAPAVS